MRRKDREITNLQDILGVLRRCEVVRLGIHTPDCPYVVPMNFGIETEGEAITLWFHGALEGLKLDLISQYPRVGFEADCSHQLITGDKACGYGMEYESVIGCGCMTRLTDPDDKRRGLQAIMRHYAPEKDFEISESELAGVCVLRLDVERITGKRVTKRG